MSFFAVIFLRAAIARIKEIVYTVISNLKLMPGSYINRYY